MEGVRVRLWAPAGVLQRYLIPANPSLAFLLLVVSPPQTQVVLLFSILCYLLLTFFLPPSQILCDIMVL